MVITINFYRYFRQGDYFGAACYEKLTVHSEIERGARMKSVGVIVANYDTLHHHLEYLAQQVRLVYCSELLYSYYILMFAW